MIKCVQILWLFLDTWISIRWLNVSLYLRAEYLWLFFRNFRNTGTEFEKKKFPGRFFSKHVLVIQRKGIFKELPYISVLCLCHFLTFKSNSLECSFGQPEVARRWAQQLGEDRWRSLFPFNISLRNERLMLSNSVAYLSCYWWVQQGTEPT